jgi:hypothetical protein
MVTHCVPCAAWKKILSFTYFLDVALLGLLGDLLSGPLTPWPGLLSLFPARLKAFYHLMLFLVSLKMVATCFKFTPLCFVICYGLTGTKLSMMELSEIL